MDGFIRGFTGGFTANKLGAAAALLVILVALHFFGWGPQALAERLKQETGA